MRHGGAAALVAVLLTGKAMAGDIAFVTSQNADSVSIVDLPEGTLRATVPVPGAPAPVAYDAAAGLAYVVSAETGVLTVLDTLGRVRDRIDLGKGAFGIAAARDRLFVTDWYGARLRALAPDGREIWSAPTGRAPAGVALSDDGAIVAVADRDDDRISAYDAETGAPLWQAPAGSHPYAVIFHDGRFWTTDVQSNSVTAITRAGVAASRLTVGDHPYGIAFAAGRGFVTDQYASTVTVFDPTAMQVIATVPVDDYPEGIAALSDGRHVALTNWDSNTLMLIDAATLKVTTVIDVPDGPRSFGSFVGPDRQGL